MRVPEFLRLEIRRHENDRLTIALAALVALILFLWGGWYVLRGKNERDMNIAASIRAAHTGVAADSMAHTTAVEDRGPPYEEILPESRKAPPEFPTFRVPLVTTPEGESSMRLGRAEYG